MVHFAAVRNVEQTSSDSTKTVYTIKAGMKSLNYGYSISGNITVYLYINGTQVKSWTGGFSSAYGETKTKYFGTYTYTVNKTHASQSVSIYTKVKNASGFDNGTDSSTTWSGTVAAKPSYGVSYNANGGSGAPAGQTKWYNETLALQAKGSLARTGYTPQGWATSAGGAAAYGFGASYTGNAALALYAAWKPNTYSVSYVTGGSAVGSTSRTFNANYTLSATKPTKDGYNFLGWATTDGGAAVYSAGQSINYNKSTAANLTLYAAWELAYARPTASLKVARDEDGSTATATASWVINEEGNTFQRAVLEWKPRASDEYTVVEEITTPGATGATFEITGASTAENYDVRLTVYDETGSGTASDILTQAYYTMDFIAGGRGVAIGAPATEEGFKCAMDATFTESLRVLKTGNGTSIQVKDSEKTLNGKQLGIALGIGGGDSLNRGIWDDVGEKWAIWLDSSNAVHYAGLPIFSTDRTASGSANVTMASGYTFTSFDYTQRGKVAEFRFTFKNSNALAAGNIADVVVATLKDSSMFPRSITHAKGVNTGCCAHMNTNGVISITDMTRSAAAGSTLYLDFTYTLA